jgi:hypothetical protein
MTKSENDPEWKLILVDAWLDVIALLISLLIAGYVLLRVMPSTDELKTECGAILACCLFAVVLLFRVWLRAAKGERMADHSGKRLEELTSSIDQLKEQYVPLTLGESRLHQVTAILLERDDWVRRAGIETVAQFMNHLSPINEHQGLGFKVESEYLALLAYRNFWDELAAHQAREKKVGRKLIVRVTHSSSPGVWENAQAHDAMASQKLFIDNGGRIVRVFLDEEEQEPDRCKLTMQEMKKNNIDVFYLQNKTVRELTSDFLWVDPYLVTWEAAADRESIIACKILRLNEAGIGKYRDQWCKVVGRQVVRKYHDLPAEIADILTSF